MATAVEATAIEQPETTALATETSAAVHRANDIVVDSSDSLLDAGKFLRVLKTIRGRINDTFDGPIKSAHTAHKDMLAAKKEHDGPLSDAEGIVKRKVATYQNEQERIRRQEEERLRAAARKQEEERRLKEAAELEAQGDDEAAEAVIEAPIPTPPVHVPKTTPKVSGVTTRKVWKFRIVNAELIPRAYMTPNVQVLGAIARNSQDRVSVAGVEFYSESSVAVSGL